MMTGIEFFASRTDLERHESLEKTLSKCETFDALWIHGHRAFNDAPAGVKKIGRLILPSPNAGALKEYAATLPAQSTLPAQIREVAKLAKANGARVKFSREFLPYSIMIFDRDGLDPYVHIEMALPYAEAAARPCIRIHKRRFEKTFRTFCEVYNKIYDAASDSQNP